MKTVQAVLVLLCLSLAFLGASPSPAPRIHRVQGYPSIQRFVNVPVSGPLFPGQERPEIVYDRAEGYVYSYSERNGPSWTQIAPCDADFGNVYRAASGFEFQLTGKRTTWRCN